jgi:hypothetical protein
MFETKLHDLGALGGGVGKVCSRCKTDRIPFQLPNMRPKQLFLACFGGFVPCVPYGQKVPGTAQTRMDRACPLCPLCPLQKIGLPKACCFNHGEICYRVTYFDG